MVVVEVSGDGYGKNRGAEKGKESEIRKGAVCNEGMGCTSSAVQGMETDEDLLQESLSARVRTARVRTAMEGYPTVP